MPTKKKPTKKKPTKKKPTKKKTTKKKPTKKKTAIYASSLDHGNADKILTMQRRVCSRLVDESPDLGEVVASVREITLGDRGLRRPKLVELVEAAERGEFDVLVCLDESRIGRSEQVEREYWLYRFAQAGVEVQFVADLEEQGIHAAYDCPAGASQSVDRLLRTLDGYREDIRNGKSPQHVERGHEEFVAHLEHSHAAGNASALPNNPADLGELLQPRRS